MTSLWITVDSASIKNVAAKLNFTSFREPTNREINAVLQKMQEAARKAAKPHAADTGTTASMITIKLGGSESPLGGKLVSGHPASAAINYGRGPGRMPPSGPLEIWAIRHGLGAGLGFAIARSISRKGTKGTHFMEKAVEVGERELASAMNRIGESIIKEIRR